MVGDMENLKIKVNDEAESKEVQELLSYLDYNGKPYLLTNKKMREDGYRNDYEIGFLFAERGGNVGCSHKTETKYFDDHQYEEITLQKLKDLAVLKRNSIDDATHICGLSKVLKLETEDYKILDATYNIWVDYIGSQTDFRRGLKPIEKEVKMKEYIAKVSGDWRLVDSHELVSGRIEVPEGAEEYRANYKFYKNNGELFYCPEGGWTKSIISEYKTLWQRNTLTLNSKDITIQEKLKFIEKWLNGEKIQYVLEVESDKIQSEKTQSDESKWHNFTEGAMQYIKRSDIKFREAPKYVTINEIEFKNVKSLLNHVKSNFDLEDDE